MGACEKLDNDPIPGDINYRQEMRRLVQSASAYARSIDADFLVIPQNGEDLITYDGKPEGPLVSGYLQAISGIGKEGLFYGDQRQINRATPAATRSEALPFLNLIQQQRKAVLITDYATDTSFIQETMTQCNNRGFLSFVADRADLSRQPDFPSPLPTQHDGEIRSLEGARNFLYLTQAGYFPSQQTYLDSLAASPYDVLIIDLFADPTAPPLSAEAVQRLQYKTGGARRLVLAYVQVGAAASNRYYWQDDWALRPPYWMETQGAQEDGLYRVRYWEPDWQEILFGNRESYLKKILDAGFDGVYLGGIEAFQAFE